MDHDVNMAAAEAAPVTVDPPTVSWTASEFIAHEKSAGWYINLAGAALLLAVLMYLFTRDMVSVVVVVVGAIFLGIFAARKPRQLDYVIDRHGVKIGAKQYGFQDFKSVSMVQESQFSAINLMPLKRFAPILTIYYAPEQEQQILTILADYLPLEEARPDRVETLMRRIRF
jgi:hypothetical protein